MHVTASISYRSLLVAMLTLDLNYACGFQHIQGQRVAVVEGIS